MKIKLPTYYFYIIILKMARFIAGDITKYVRTDTVLVLNKISKWYIQNFGKINSETYCSFRFYKRKWNPWNSNCAN